MDLCEALWHRDRGQWERQAAAVEGLRLLYLNLPILLQGGLLKDGDLMAELRGADRDFLAYQFPGLGKYLSFGMRLWDHGPRRPG